jgi:hypothetical protein
VLEAFTIETFADHIAEQFSVSVEAGAVEVELIGATALAQTSGRAIQTPVHRAPFSLEFLGPPERLLLQGTYPFEHPALGVFDIFVVPIGRDETGIRYEAVFT